MPFDINPMTAKWQTGDKPETKGKNSRHLFIFLVFNIIFSDLLFQPTFSVVKLDKMRTIHTVKQPSKQHVNALASLKILHLSQLKNVIMFTQPLEKWTFYGASLTSQTQAVKKRGQKRKLRNISRKKFRGVVEIHTR